ncbi:MAG: DUF1707 domain-containing protein [Streptosporangiaceae bacterium]
MATGSNIRVGDADRDATATQLREHYAAGRLTLDELNERLEQTFAARTGADLKAVTRDLPSLDGAWARAGGPAADSSLSAPLPRSDQGQQDQGQWDQGQWDQGRRRPGYSVLGVLVPVMLAIWALLLLGGAFGFGFGGGRPLAVVLLVAVVGMIRRLFGGRRGYGRPYGRRCGRRW